MESEVLDEAWCSLPPAQRSALESVADRVARLLPGASLDLSWGMPSFRIDGDLVLSIQGFTEHNSLFPGSEVIEELGDELAGYTCTKGTIHFERDKPMPARTVRSIVEGRVRLINASYPRKSGQFKEFFGNGRLKARGRMKGDVPTSSWEWFRKDGTRLRSGSFRAGRQTGTWTTYDQAGHPYKSTDFS